MKATTAALAAIFSLTVAIAGGRAQTDEEREFTREQFADWGGIVFRCLPDKADDDLQKRLCIAAGAEARFLAAAANTPFRDLGSEEYFRVAKAVREINHGLVLEAELSATQGQPRAIHMRLSAAPFYTDAVETHATEGPESKPRSGTLELWDRSVIGAGGSDIELEQALSNAFSTVLKQFFAIFIESRN